ncbi:type IV pilus assembly protein PilW [Roseateles sp. YR242]|uniref:PilW family protein n=1 Tax=Roseateles sp. YR242 TaxID=1855305 RepID=UPI0008C5507C|nr:PilW family protein [Roseateles sp. YR242]SEL27094.1 type IV pilus assembly protein PilW [Roseateles sp. YR242]
MTLLRRLMSAGPSRVRRFPFTPRTTPARGFSLIELMVSIVIALGMIVAMGLVMGKFETAKREGASSSDMSSTAAYLSYDLDRQVRNAGSGFSTAYAEVFGCELTASRDGAQILPSLQAFPAPFASVPTTLRMVPLMVFPAVGPNTAKSDVIQLMSGTAGVGEVATQIRVNSVQTNTLRLTAATGLLANDLLLVSESSRPCMLEQVSSAYTANNQQVDLAGTFYASVINGQALNDRSTGAYAHAMSMGNASNGNRPKFLLLGVNASNQLVRYDLLRFGNAGTSLDQGIPVAEGVMDMKVRYGVDTSATADGIVDAWVTPDDTSYNVGTLNAATSQALLMRVLAVKIDLVLRSDTIEKTTVAPASLTLFSGLATNLQATYTVADRYRRHTVVEVTVPIRNALANSGRTTPL